MIVYLTSYLIIRRVQIEAEALYSAIIMSKCKIQILQHGKLVLYYDLIFT